MVENIKSNDLRFWGLKSNQQILEVMGLHFVKMPSEGVLFKKDSHSGIIDWKNPFSISRFINELEDFGLIARESKMKRLIDDERLPFVEPIQILYDIISQKEWSGRDWISEIRDNLNLKGDPEENLLLLTKFFTSAYSLSFKEIDPLLDWEPFNRVVLILYSHGRGFRKTSLARKIGCSGVLREKVGLDVDVYSDCNGALPKEQRLLDQILVSNFLTNLDDIDGVLMNVKEKGRLRSIISSQTTTFRPLWSNSTKTALRRTSFIATTNKGHILSDEEENRYLVFEMEDKIDSSWMSNFDPLDLWRQVKQLAHKFKVDSRFTDEELDLIRKRTVNNLHTSPLEDLLREYFEYDPEGEMKMSEIKKVCWLNNIPFTNFSISSVLVKICGGDITVAKKKKTGLMYWRLRERGDIGDIEESNLPKELID